jgi:hypothetical protein
LTTAHKLSGRAQNPPSLPGGQHHTRTKGFGHLGGPVDTDITLKNPRTGKVLRHIHASSETEEEKKNKKRNPKYARLCSFDPWRIFTISQNVVTGKPSIAIRRCKYPLYETLDAEKLMQFYAAIAVCGLPFPSSEVLNYKTSNKLDPRQELSFRYHVQQFREKIKVQRKAYKISVSAHKRKGLKAHRRRR